MTPLGDTSIAYSTSPREKTTRNSSSSQSGPSASVVRVSMSSSAAYSARYRYPSPQTRRTSENGRAGVPSAMRKSPVRAGPGALIHPGSSVSPSRLMAPGV